MKTRCAIMLIAALSSIAASAQNNETDSKPATPPRSGLDQARKAPEAIFRFADRDHDGRLSTAEVTPLTQRLPQFRFESVDANKDGYLTPEELRTQGRKALSEIDLKGAFATADKNGDQALSKEEFKQAFPSVPDPAFARLDRNGDGKLSGEDGLSSMGAPGRTPSATEDDASFLRSLLKKSDANGDGRVSFEELTQKRPGFPKDAFDQIDANDDGVLSLEDFPKVGAGRSKG